MKVTYHTLYFGADPEFFFTKGGEVIGAEKVVPKEGIQNVHPRTDAPFGKPLVIIDGVQAEFNPEPNSCRQSFSENLKACFVRVASEMSKDKDVKADFAQLVEVTKKEMETLSPETQQFGCSPSKNAYKESTIAIKDASKYQYRSAGGHVHLGYYDTSTRDFFREHPTKVIQMLDVILGNTCVLLDRSEGNVERRKVYGKAGEYRTPAHGLEYRTLSNFWLRSYQLMSFVLGMARFAVCVAMDEKAYEAVLAQVDMDRIQKAINNNDFELAYANFNAVKEVLSNIGAIDSGEFTFPLEGKRVTEFEHLVKMGVDHFFAQDPMTHWLNQNWRTQHGWENFADYVLGPAIGMEVTKPEPASDTPTTGTLVGLSTV